MSHGTEIATHKIDGRIYHFFFVGTIGVYHRYKYIYAERADDKACVMWQPPDEYQGWYGCTSTNIDKYTLAKIEPVMLNLMKDYDVSGGFDRLSLYKPKRLYPSLKEIEADNKY